MIKQKEYCDNTNSVKYIIENNDYILFQTRNFSIEDAIEFAKYGSAEEFQKLPNSVKHKIFWEGSKNYSDMNSEIFQIFINEGKHMVYKDVEYDNACIFVENRMHEHLAIILSKLNLTQHHYADLFFHCACQKCMFVIASHLNGEGIEIVREKLNGNIMCSYVTYIVLFIILILISTIVFIYGFRFMGFFAAIIIATIGLCCYCFDTLATIKMYNVIYEISTTRDGFLRV